MVVGVGLNVQHGEFPDDVDGLISAVSDFYEGEIDRNELCIELVQNMDRYILRSNALQGEVGDTIERLKACSASLGKQVRVMTPEENFDARVLNIAPNGGLVVDTAEGERTITSGEILHIR